MAHARFFWLGLLAGVGAVANAAEENSLATVRRDVEALKQNVPVTDRVRINVPQIDAPALQGTPAASPVVPSSALERARHNRGARWLIEAMQKDRTKTAGELLLMSEQERERFLTESESVDQAPEEESSDTSERLERQQAAPNPLDGFMASWMTPQDYALLGKPESSEALLPPGPETRALDARPPEFSTDAIALPELRAVGAHRTPTDAAASATLPNPYLPIAIEPVRSVSPPVQAVTPAPPEPMRAPVTPARATPPAPTPSFPAELQKRTQNEKQFPQLKHF